MVDVAPEPKPQRTGEPLGWEGTAAMPAVRPPVQPEAPQAKLPAPPAFLLGESGQAIPLTGETTSIGRAVDNDIVLGASSVSRHHAKIVWDSDRYYLIDRESTNGSFVNGKRVHRQPLSEEDELLLGETAFTFHLADPEQ